VRVAPASQGVTTGPGDWLSPPATAGIGAPAVAEGGEGAQKNAKNLRLYERPDEEILTVVRERIVEKEQLEKLTQGANAGVQGEK
jgi:hypothetical protein